MTRDEAPLSADRTEKCPNCGATMPGNLVARGEDGYCDLCVEMEPRGFTVDRDADHSDYRHPRA